MQCSAGDMGGVTEENLESVGGQEREREWKK